jgi:hypothetical protein
LCYDVAGKRVKEGTMVESIFWAFILVVGVLIVVGLTIEMVADWRYAKRAEERLQRHKREMQFDRDHDHRRRVGR